MIYCALLNPSVDVVYETDELKIGDVLLDVPSQIYPSGKSINVATIIKALGEEVSVCGIIPEYNLKMFEDFLNKKGIKSFFYKFKGMARINTTIREKNSQMTTHINSEAKISSMRIQQEALDFFSSYMSKGDLWVFSGSIPKGFDTNYYKKLIGLCKDKKCLTVFDSRGEFFKFGVRAKPLMIKPNLFELEQFFGEQIIGIHHIALKAKRLADMGIKYVFISLGSDGILAVNENECLLCNAPQVNVCDAVGAGDACVAGLVAGYIRNFSFPEMCRLGVACGTSKVMHCGPYNISVENVWQLMEEVKVKSI